MAWMLVRQDTHGSRFDVAAFDIKADAVIAMQEYESGYPHHQTYYVERRESSTRTSIIPVPTGVTSRPTTSGDLATGITSRPTTSGDLATGVTLRPTTSGDLATGITSRPTTSGDLATGITLRPTTGGDLATLRTFFADPGFNEQWGGRALTDDEITAKYLGQRSPQVECFLVVKDQVPIGFIQHCADEDGDEGGGIDFVLAPAARGEGIGTAVVHALVSHLRLECGWQRITVDPDVANARGVNFWTGVGFVLERLVDDDPERESYYLMSWPIDS